MVIEILKMERKRVISVGRLLQGPVDYRHCIKEYRSDDLKPLHIQRTDCPYTNFQVLPFSPLIRFLENIFTEYSRNDAH